MADKLKQTVSAWISFVAGEQPSPEKLNALVALLERGLGTIEYAIGDILSQSWPYATDDAGAINPSFLTTPWGRQITADLKLTGASASGRPLDIINLARLVGPASNLNPQFLTDTGNSGLVGWSIPSDVNEFQLPYKPETTPTFTRESGAASTTFQNAVSAAYELTKDGDYFVRSDGRVFTYKPTGSDDIVDWSTDPSKWGGGSNYEGATFNVIPDPNQVANGTALEIEGPYADGSYGVTLPILTHAQKNLYSDSVELDRSNDASASEQLILPRWMTENFSNGDVLPQGCIYLKCVNTNEVFTEAIYVYDTSSTLELRNVDLGADGCGLSYCLLTVGTDLTTSVDDIRRKLFSHTHDGTFGDSPVSITNIVDILIQGDSAVSWGGPYFPSSISGNWMPQYLHRDGYRIDPDTSGDGFACFEQDRVSSSKRGPSHNNALRGSLVIGRRVNGSNLLGSFDEQESNYTESSDQPLYFDELGESFYLTFGGVPVFHNAGGTVERSTALPQGSSQNQQGSLDELNNQAPQIYRSQWNELRIESQDSDSASALVKIPPYQSSFYKNVSTAGVISNADITYNANGIGLYARASIILDNVHHTGSGDVGVQKNIIALCKNDLIFNVGNDITVYGEGDYTSKIEKNYFSYIGGTHYRSSEGHSTVETEKDYFLWAGKEQTHGQAVFSANPDRDPSDVGGTSDTGVPYGAGNANWGHFNFHFLTQFNEGVTGALAGKKWSGIAIWNPDPNGLAPNPPSFADYTAANHAYAYDFSAPGSMAEAATSAPRPRSAQLWVRGTHGQWDNDNWIAVLDNDIAWRDIVGLQAHNGVNNALWSEGVTRGLLIGTPQLTAAENALTATIWAAFRAKDKCVGKIISFRTDHTRDGSGGAGWLDGAAWNTRSVVWSEASSASPLPIDAHQDETGPDSTDELDQQTAGDVAYISGGKDYGEYLQVGDPEEWKESVVSKEYLNFKSGDPETLADDIPNGWTFGLPEGLLVTVRDGKIWKDGSGTPMFITHRPCVVGNQNVELGGKPYDTVSFVGQLPVIAQGNVKDGFLAVPVEGSPWCKAVDKETATFEQYKKAVGTFWESFEQADNAIGPVLCAVGVK